jgi:alkylation response protein AidB-like acyl-CoA dehydrogenase
MDLTLDESQQDVVSALRSVLTKFAGPERAGAVMAGDGYDSVLARELDQLGVLDPEFQSEYGPHMMFVFAEEAARAAAIVPLSTELLVRPHLSLPGGGDGPVALLTGRDTNAGVPFAAQSRTFVVVTKDRVELLENAPPVGIENRTFGVPVAPVNVAQTASTIALDASAAGVLAWWRLAVTAEIVGAAEAGLALTIDHLTARRQFGRPLASLQAIQHRLAEVHVKIEGTRWLGRYAAYHGADPGDAAAAAAHAVATATAAIWELQQLQGAIGFTLEYALHHYTLRLHVLRMILGGMQDAHAADAARARWLAHAAPNAS